MTWSCYISFYGWQEKLEVSYVQVHLLGVQGAAKNVPQRKMLFLKTFSCFLIRMLMNITFHKIKQARLFFYFLKLSFLRLQRLLNQGSEMKNKIKLWMTNRLCGTTHSGMLKSWDDICGFSLGLVVAGLGVMCFSSCDLKLSVCFFLLM